jgi:hypothetical protein
MHYSLSLSSSSFISFRHTHLDITLSSPSSADHVPCPWKTSTYLFLTPFLAALAGRFEGGLESKSSILDPGGLLGPEGGRGGPPAPGGPGGGVIPGVALSASDDF